METVNNYIQIIARELFVVTSSGENRYKSLKTVNRFFLRCGEVTDVFITEKGYAFVTMADESGAENAIKELNGQTIDGQEIKVDNARPRGDRGGRRGGGFRGGRGRGGFGGGRGGGGFRGGKT